MIAHRILMLPAVTVLLAAGTAATADAQTSQRPWQINVHTGIVIPDEDLVGDEDDAQFALGGRLSREIGNGFSVEGAFDWVAVTDVRFAGGFESDVHLFFYSGNLRYTIPTWGPLKVFVGGGAGAGTVVYDDQPAELDDDSATAFLLPVFGGVEWRRPGGRWGLRADVRDHILFLDEEDTAFVIGDDTEAMNNIEVTGGISFYF